MEQLICQKCGSTEYYTEVKANNNYDPEYFIWKFSNPEDLGE